MASVDKADELSQSKVSRAFTFPGIECLICVAIDMGMRRPIQISNSCKWRPLGESPYASYGE